MKRALVPGALLGPLLAVVGLLGLALPCASGCKTLFPAQGDFPAADAAVPDVQVADTAGYKADAVADAATADVAADNAAADSGAEAAVVDAGLADATDAAGKDAVADALGDVSADAGKDISTACPTAVVAVEPKSALAGVSVGTKLTFDGKGSTAVPPATVAKFQWGLFKPSASMADLLPSTAAATVTLVPDLAGAYIVTLSVTDNTGVTSCAPAMVEVQAK